MAFAETAPLIAQLDLKGNFTSSLKKAQGQLGQFSTSLGKAGRGVGQLGAGFARVGAIAGTAVVGGLVGAAKAAIDFEDAFAGVRKTVDEADLAAAGLSFEQLAKQFRQMATEIPIAATEFARIGEAAGALGIKAKDIDEFTKTVALLGVTTDLTSDAAAESLGKIGTILAFTGKDFEEFADILVNLGNKGASVESEIIEVTKRFAAQGKQAGLTTANIAALASVITSLGAEPESGGSALSRIFSNMGTEIALDTKKADAFARVTAGIFDDFSKAGDRGFLKETAKEITRLQGSIQKGEALPEFLTFLTELGKLDRLDAAKALKGAGITNVRDRNAILLMAQNVGEVRRQLDVANESTGALGKEAAKRFDTIRSKLTLLKNNFVEAGITIGEGFLPALGRVTEKLIAFLKVDANKTALKSLGEDIGKSLDGINWDEVLANTRNFVGILKEAAGVAMSVLSVLNKLPTEIKAAGLGFLALNKLSGGLVGAGAGNLIGGLAETVIKSVGSRLPGPLGAAFAQPVYVTNWAMMAGGGLGGDLLGGKGLLGKVLNIVSKVVLVGLVAEFAKAIQDPLDNIADNLHKSLIGDDNPLSDFGRAFQDWRKDADWPFGQKNAPDWAYLGGKPPEEDSDSGGKKGNRGIPEMFGPPTPGKGAPPGFRDSPRTAPANLADLMAIMERGRKAGYKPTLAAAQNTNQKNLERIAAAQLVKQEQIRTAADTRSELVNIRNAVTTAGTKVPTTNVKVEVNVTAAQVTKSVTKQVRYGPGGGSRDRQGLGTAWGGSGA